MNKYIKQYDLPCYPNNDPQPGCRDIIGLEKGSGFDESFHGFSKWMGGCGIGHVEAGTSTQDALEDLREQVGQRLRQRIKEAQERLEWDTRLLHRWETDPEQFAINPLPKER